MEESAPTCIVAAVDLDELSAEALRKAAFMAKTSGARLLAVHISSASAPVAPISLPGTSGLVEEAKRAILEEAELKVRKMIETHLDEDAPKPEIVVHHHPSPAEALCAFADGQGADLIVVGAHRRSGLGRILLGSVAESVVRRAPCDVLVVRPQT
ncbi:MAG: universal stress protein [Deltaproteobacteria bacterium]|nr:universal stress protein [Deltaproteobacteria bacterium]